jgi:hypothetical protein
MESDLDKSAILVCFVVYADSATSKPVSKIRQSIGENYKKLQHTEVQHR